TQFAEGVTHRNLNRLEHLKVALGLIEGHEADRIDGRDERRRAAVHDRRFRAVDLDGGVVDAETGEGRKHMLGGGYQRARFVAQHGGELGRGDSAHVGGDLAIRAALDARTDKAETGTGVGRVQRQRYRLARMYTNTAA